MLRAKRVRRRGCRGGGVLAKPVFSRGSVCSFQKATNVSQETATKEENRLEQRFGCHLEKEQSPSSRGG